jgi:hypothetical protein
MLVKILLSNLQRLPKNYISGYNDPKYLGSTGFLPALQSYICRWNNTCYNQTKTSDEFNAQSSFVLSFIDSYTLVFLFLDFGIEF